MQDMSNPLTATKGTPISLLAGPHSQGGTKSNVTANTEVQITLPITFSDYGYTALAIPSGSTPVYLSKDAFSHFRILKTANVGSFVYWLALGY